MCWCVYRRTDKFLIPQTNARQTFEGDAEPNDSLRQTGVSSAVGHHRGVDSLEGVLRSCLKLFMCWHDWHHQAFWAATCRCTVLGEADAAAETTDF